jgi:hypothetical protein
LIARLAGPVAAIVGLPNRPVSWFRKRPAFSRLVLLLIVAALLVVGLAVGETEEILFKGSIL